MTNILVAGATGMLGSRIAHHLAAAPRDQVSRLTLLVRPGTRAGSTTRAAVLGDLEGKGALVVEGDLSDEASLRRATEAVDVVVSAVQGGPEVVVDGQHRLASAARSNGATRFIASDFAIDLFNAPAQAPMFASRRQVALLLDALDLEVQHVLTGGFLDLMLHPSNTGMIDADRSTVTYWGEGTERFDLTTVEDTARITARLAADPAPHGGVLMFSAAQTSMHGVAAALEAATGRAFERRSLGTVSELQEAVARESDPRMLMGLWYQLCLATTPPFPAVLNDRYPDLDLVGLEQHLARTYDPQPTR